MRRTSKPIALFLLAMAVLCSPAGVCVIDGVAATAVQAAAPAHAHACDKSGDGAFLVASDGSCCSESRAGFLNVFRFTLHKQAPPAILTVAAGWMPKPAVTDRIVFDRRAPLVLRI